MMEKEEKIVEEKTIIDGEKENIASAEEAIVAAKEQVPAVAVEAPAEDSDEKPAIKSITAEEDDDDSGEKRSIESSERSIESSKSITSDSSERPAIKSITSGSEEPDAEAASAKRSLEVAKIDESDAEEHADKIANEKAKLIVAEAKKAAKANPHKAGDKLGDLECFEIAYNGGKGDDGKEYVLEVEQKDKYAPKKTGVYNVYMAASVSDISDEEDAKTGNHKLAQQWSYKADTKTLYSKMFPSRALFEGANKNLIIYKARGLKN